MSRRNFSKNQSVIKKAKRDGFNHRRKFPFCLLTFILIIFIGLIIGQSKYLIVQAIEIEHPNPNLISREEIGEMLNSLKQGKWLFILQKNTLLTLTNGQIKNQLLADSRVDSIKISRYWLKRKIKIVISEKQPSVQLSILGDKDYYLDSSGQIIQAVPLHILRPLAQQPEDNIYILSANNLPVIFDRTTLTWGSTELINGLKNALKALKTLDNGQDGLSIVSMEIREQNGILGAKALTNRGWDILLTLDKSIDNQMDNLALALDNQLKDKEIEYIDLRFGNKIFYK